MQAATIAQAADVDVLVEGIATSIEVYARAHPFPLEARRGSLEETEWTVGCMEDQAVSVSAYETGFGVGLRIPAMGNDPTRRPELVLAGCQLYPEAMGLLGQPLPPGTEQLRGAFERQPEVLECLRAANLPFDEAPSFDAYVEGGGRWDAYAGDHGVVSFGMDIRAIPDSLIADLPETERTLVESIQTCPVVIVGLPVDAP